jgi:DNA-binding IclR family transcriptional regulator
MRSTSRNGVLVVAKAFAVLDAFRPDGPAELSLGEIAGHAGVPKPTAHRIVTSLVAEGALERGHDGYRLGLRLFELGERVHMKRDVREAALPFLQDLYGATHHTVHLAVLEGRDVVYVERIRGHDPVPLPSSVGGRQPAHCTAVGKALLAHRADVMAILATTRLRAKTRHTITDPAVLEHDLARVRTRGVAIDREEAVLGVHCVAAPIFVDGAAIASLSVSGPSSKIDVDALVVAVRSAASGVGRTLGNTMTRAVAPSRPRR